MELADGFKTLRSLQSNSRYKLYENIARYELIMLAIEQRIVHRDFHSENIMINENYDGYFDGINGKCLLIDFGEINKINNVIAVQIEDFFRQENYVSVINLIYDTSIPEPLRNYPGYTWFKNINEDDVSKIKELINARKISKSELEKYSREVRENNPDSEYPIIPLKLINYQKQLPKMVFQLLLGGNFPNNFYTPKSGETVHNLLEKILKTISIGINSFSIFKKKITKNVKNAKQINPYKNTVKQYTNYTKDVPNMIDVSSQFQNSVALETGGKNKYKTYKRKKSYNKRNKTYKRKKSNKRNKMYKR